MRVFLNLHRNLMIQRRDHGRQPEAHALDRTEVRGWRALGPRLNRRTHVRGHDDDQRLPGPGTRMPFDHRREPRAPPEGWSQTGRPRDRGSPRSNLGRQPDLPVVNPTDLHR